MRELVVLFLHLLATVARLAGPGGARSVVAESVLLKHQLLILNRSRKRSPTLRVSDRMVAGASRSRIRCQAATGSWTRSLQWQTQRTWFRSAGTAVCPLAKASGVWPSNDAWRR